MGVVTVSRQYGAGGLRVAAALADRLRYTFVDRELTEQAARRLGMDPHLAESRDERPPALVEEIGLALAASTPGFDLGPLPELDDRALAEATRQVLATLADVGGYVILGRGSQAALQSRADACHISLVGNLNDRVRRIMASQGVDEKEAAARCERVDADRAGYVKRFYGKDIRDPLLYDCILNTSRVGLDGAVSMAVEVASQKLGLS
jgi:cytidylate kinase